MTKEEHIRYWIESADSDLEVAETLLIAGKNLWCLFICHLVIEKALKAHFVFQFDDTPPKINNLINLATKVGLNLNYEQKILLDNLNLFQISARYPEFKEKLNQTCTQEFTNEIFQKVKEIFEWLKFQLK